MRQWRWARKKEETVALGGSLGAACSEAANALKDVLRAMLLGAEANVAHGEKGGSPFVEQKAPQRKHMLEIKKQTWYC